MAVMKNLIPTARLGVILSSGNRTVEPYFRKFAPVNLGVYATRMRMGSGGRKAADDIQIDALAASELLADTGVDVIDLQATGIMMERGPEGEAAIVRSINEATGISVYTATQAVVEAFKALSVDRIILIHPSDDRAIARETAYLEAVGLSVTHAVGLQSGERQTPLPPEYWVSAALDQAQADGNCYFLSGSFTTMIEAVAPIEAATDKPVVTSIQAALWAGVDRLSDKIGDFTPPAELGLLFKQL